MNYRLWAQRYLFNIAHIFRTGCCNILITRSSLGTAQDGLLSGVMGKRAEQVK